MKTIAVAALYLAAMPAIGLAQTAEPAVQAQPVDVQYAMAVGADGRMTGLGPASRELPEAIDRWIRKRVGEYAFEPATVNGTPQPATTTLYLTLGPVSRPDGKLGYRIAALSTGAKLQKVKFDHHPRDAGAAYFIVTYDQVGKVTEVEVDEESAAPIGGGSFRKWGLALARSFRFEPETVAGAGVPGQARMPIIHCGGRQCPELPPLRPELGSNLGGELVASSVLKAKAPPPEI